MNPSTFRHARLLLGALIAMAACGTTARAVIQVHDLRIDFSNVNNPNGVWTYLKGATPLTHFTPVPTSLAAAVSGGYWGDNGANLNGAMMLSTANGSAAPLHTDNDFISGHVLIRTTDPAGQPTIVTWTAPSAGTFTYSGGVWYADASAGPFGNSFTMTFNAGPIMESGTASLGQDYPNGVSFVNGLTPVNVIAGDVVSLELKPLAPSPFGTLAGVTWTIDFLPVPEPATLGLLAIGGGIALAFALRRKLGR